MAWVHKHRSTSQYKVEFDEWVDIAARIAMKEVGYAGTYDPLNESATQQAGIDWIKSDTQVKQFGFHGMDPKLFKVLGFESILGSAKPKSGSE